MNSVHSFFLACYFAFWGVGFINQIIFRSYLQKHLPGDLKHLFPSIFKKSISSDLNSIKFIFIRGYSKILKPAEVYRCDIHLAISSVCMAAVLTGLVMFPIYFSHHPHTQKAEQDAAANP